MLYKLDAGVDHVLVDEAQDTSSDQWAILESLTDEFFGGEGAPHKLRTIFAVGDEKQSIFSFQGADVDLFASKRRDFERRVTRAGRRFESVRLNLSFRSAKGLLDEVDNVFDALNHHVGVVAEDDPWMPHEAWKSTLPGPRRSVGTACARAESRSPTTGACRSTARTSRRRPCCWRDRIATTIARWLEPGSREAVHDKKGAKRARARGRRAHPRAQARRVLRRGDPRAEGEQRAGRRRRQAGADQRTSPCST